VYTANATGAVQSSLAAPDTIIGFVTGTDKLNITNAVSGAPVALLGNYTTVAQAQAAVAADGRAGLAYFVTADATLYVTNANTGVAVPLDTVIYLPGVTTLSNNDLLVGSQGVSTAATITLSAPAANLSNTVSLNVTSSALTTGLDDVISSSTANMVGSTINGGAGSDTLTISTATGATLTSLAAAGAAGATVSSVENITFSAGTGTMQMPGDTNLLVTNGSATAGTTALTMGAGAGQRYVATGSGANTVTLGAGLGQSATITGSSGIVQIVNIGGVGQSVSTGAGNDIISSSAAASLGSTFNGGAGLTDALNFTTAGALVLTSAAATAGVSSSIAGIETIHVVGGNTLTITPDQALTVNLDGTGAGSTIIGTGSTITVTATTATVNATTYTADLTDTLGLQGTSNFTSAALYTGTITNIATGTVAVAVGTTGTVNSTTAITVNAAAATGAVAIQNVGAFTVTGLGTAAGGDIQEAATHVGGALTVTTASTNGGTVTMNAAGTGPVNLTHAGTGTLTVVSTAAHGAINVIASAANTVTISGNSVLNYSVSGTAAAHTITSTTTGAAGDTVVGGAAVDTVTLGAGADRFTTGGGADVVNITAPTTDTGIIAGFALSAAVPVNGTVLNVSGLDIVFGVTAGVTILLTNEAAGSAVNATSYNIFRNGSTLGNETAGNAAQLVGTYNATTNQFTVDLAGTSSLFVYDDNGIGNATAGAYRGIVLVGYVDAGGADTYVGTTTTGHTWTAVA